MNWVRSYLTPPATQLPSPLLSSPLTAEPLVDERAREMPLSRVAKLTTFGASIAVTSLPAALFPQREREGSFSWGLSFSLSCSHCVKLIKVVGWLGVAVFFLRCCKRVFLLVRPSLRHPFCRLAIILWQKFFCFYVIGFLLLFAVSHAFGLLFVIVLVVGPLLPICMHSKK